MAGCTVNLLDSGSRCSFVRIVLVGPGENPHHSWPVKSKAAFIFRSSFFGHGLTHLGQLALHLLKLLQLVELCSSRRGNERWRGKHRSGRCGCGGVFNAMLLLSAIVGKHLWRLLSLCSLLVCRLLELRPTVLLLLLLLLMHHVLGQRRRSALIRGRWIRNTRYHAVVMQCLLRLLRLVMGR
jgi:hypothetical protein